MAGRRAFAAALALAAASAVTAPNAAAHRTHPTVVARVDRVEPPLDDAVVEVRAGIADQLVVVNLGYDPVEVLDATGKAFVRVSHDTVEADLSNPAWAASLVPYPLPSRPAGRPGWTVVATQGSWAWFDHRLHEVDRPDDLTRGAAAPVRLGEWAVPLRHRGRVHTVRGHVEARPVLGQFRSRVTRHVDGVDVDVLDGRVPGLFVRWKGEGTLTVRGIEGEPFARFTGTGVEVNERSATWRDDRALRGERVEPGIAERWRSQGTTPSLTWLDRRLAYTPGVPPDAALRRTKPSTVVEWEVPVTVNGAQDLLTGETTWHPNGSGADTTDLYVWTVAASVGAFALLLALAVARGSRRRRVEP